MATGVDGNIFVALANRLSALTFIPALDIAWPNVDYPGEGGAKASIFLEAQHIPNETVTYSVGKGQGMRQGLFQVSVMYTKGAGIVKPLDIAHEVILHFAKGTILFSDSAKVVVNRVPWASGPIIDDDRIKMPITIPYEATAI
ncbi:phage tail terminator-like protein [Martelella limonii]|uniref:phage tail terminator-like protein n=1 Tax=Martelella limonii TaxID=1647649 RepID=UPI0015810A91|nr:phage tail terminator-like protein [Martelella limonii]